MKWPREDIIMVGFSIGTGPATILAADKGVGALVLSFVSLWSITSY
jgi:hypothetical protein